MSEESTVETTGAELETPDEVEDASVSEEEEETQSSDDEESEETNSQEAKEGDGGEEKDDKPSHELTAEERKAQLSRDIQELANARRSLKETLAAEQEEQVKAIIRKMEEEKPPFIDVTVEQLEAHVRAEVEAIEDLRADGKLAEAFFRQRNLDKLCSDFDQNEAKRRQWESEQERKKQQLQSAHWDDQAMTAASEAVRVSRRAKPEDWKLMEQWFDAKAKEDPLLDLQFRELVKTQGPAHAILWKHAYVTKETGKKAKADREKRESGKKQQLSSSPDSGGGSSVKTFADFMKLTGKEQVEFSKKHPKTFEKILESKMSKAL